MAKQQTACELFAGMILRTQQPEPGDVDGFTIEDLAIQSGMYFQVEVGGPCGEECQCAEVGFPTKCNRLTDAGKQAIRAAIHKAEG